MSDPSEPFTDPFNQAPLKKVKLSPTRKKFMNYMEFNFPLDGYRFDIDSAGEFIDPATLRMYQVYMIGRKDQQYFEPGAFIIGRLEEGKLVFSDNPRILPTHGSATYALNGLKKKQPKSLFFIWGLSAAAFSFMKRQLGVEELPQIPMITRKNDSDSRK